MSEGKFGPKMLALTDKQQRFVINLLTQGIRNYTEAAALAGYSNNGNGSHGGLKVTAHRLAHDDKINAAIEEEGRRRFKGMIPWAINLIEAVGDNQQSTGAERLKAAGMVLDRAGMHAVSERINTSGDSLIDDPDRLNRIQALARALGKPIEELIGQRMAARLGEPSVSEAVFEDISTEGLEDLL